MSGDFNNEILLSGDTSGGGDFDYINMVEPRTFLINGEVIPGDVLGADSDGKLTWFQNDFASSSIENSDGTQKVWCMADRINIHGDMSFDSKSHPLRIEGAAPGNGKVLATDAVGDMVWADSSSVGVSDRIVSANGDSSVICMDTGGVVFDGTPTFGTAPFVIDGVAGTVGEVISVNASGLLVWVDLHSASAYTAGLNIVIDNAAHTIATSTTPTFNTVTLSHLNLTDVSPPMSIILDGDSGLQGQVIGKDAANILKWVDVESGGGGDVGEWKPIAGGNIGILYDYPATGDAFISVLADIHLNSITAVTGTFSGKVTANILEAVTQFITSNILCGTLNCTQGNIHTLNLQTKAGVPPRVFLDALPGSAVKNYIVVDNVGHASWEPVPTPPVPVNTVAAADFVGGGLHIAAGVEHLLTGQASSTGSAIYLLEPGTLNFRGTIRCKALPYVNSTDWIAVGLRSSSSTVLRGSVRQHMTHVAQSASSPYSVAGPLVSVCFFDVALGIKDIRFGNSAGSSFSHFKADKGYEIDVTYGATSGVIDIDVRLWTSGIPMTQAEALQFGAINPVGLP